VGLVLGEYEHSSSKNMGHLVGPPKQEMAFYNFDRMLISYGG
jgi:hypothetical protein